MATLEAQQRVYDLFRRESPPKTIDGCPCCLSEDDIRELLSTPLRELTENQLEKYAGSVFLTVGSASDYRYFLPRILELAIGNTHWLDMEIPLKRLAESGWQRWPAGESAAILALLSAAFDEAIHADHDLARDIDSWICGLALAGIDTAPFLRRLEDPAVEKALFEFFEWNAETLRHRKLDNGFWEGRGEISAPVVDWFESEAVQKLISARYGAVPRT